MIPRVGEGYYTSNIPKMTMREYLLVQHVLREMRQVTSRLVVNGGKHGWVTKRRRVDA